MGELQWYALQLYVEQDKFLSKYPHISEKVRTKINELLYFKKPDRALYERDIGGIFVGYVFVNMCSSDVRSFNRAIKKAGLGEILGYAEGVAQPLSDEDVERIIGVMRSKPEDRVAIGMSVRIKSGPYEGFEGAVTDIVGQVATVRVELRRSTSYAEVWLDNIEIIG